MLDSLSLTACQFMEEPVMAMQIRESKHPYDNNTNFEVLMCFSLISTLLCIHSFSYGSNTAPILPPVCPLSVPTTEPIVPPFRFQFAPVQIVSHSASLSILSSFYLFNAPLFLSEFCPVKPLIGYHTIYKFPQFSPHTASFAQF